MNHPAQTILQVAGGVYLLIIGLAVLGLILALINKLIKYALNTGRRCSRKITATRRKP